MSHARTCALRRECALEHGVVEQLDGDDVHGLGGHIVLLLGLFQLDLERHLGRRSNDQLGDRGGGGVLHGGRRPPYLLLPGGQRVVSFIGVLSVGTYTLSLENTKVKPWAPYSYFRFSSFF